MTTDLESLSTEELEKLAASLGVEQPRATMGEAVQAAVRGAAPQLAGAAGGAALGSVVPGVGTVAGAGAGALAMTILELVDQLGGTNYIKSALSKLGLPEPQSPEGRAVEAASKGAAGVSGLTAGAGALAPAAGGWLRGLLEQLSANPTLGMASGAAAGVAGQAAEEGGGGPGEVLGASMLGAVAPSAAAGALRTVGGMAQSTRDVIGAAAGHKPSVERLTARAAKERVGEDMPQVMRALESAKTWVPGAKPTVAEAIAGHQVNSPTQFGGALVKLQSELTGVRGAEDVLPAAARKQEGAINSFMDWLSRTVAPKGEAALQRAQAAGGVPERWLRQEIVLRTLKPGESPIVDRVVGGVLSDLRRYTTSNGVIDPKDLYAIRQKVGGIIRRQVENTADDALKKRASMIERRIQEAMDDAIEKAGGTGWKRYLKEYSSGMRRVELHQERAARVQEMLNTLKSQQSHNLAREQELRPPKLLERWVVLLNYALSAVAKDANEAVIREMANRMRDPKYFAELLKRPPNSPARQTAGEVLSRAGLVASLIEEHEKNANDSAASKSE